MNEPEMQNGSSQEKNSSASPASAPQQDSWRSLIAYIAVAAAIAMFIRVFIAAPYIVSGSSMEPNFYNYHYLIIDRLSYRFEQPVRGDVIVLDLPQQTSHALIKRLVGLPGETVVIRGSNVVIKNAAHPDGFELAEPYLDPADLGGIQNLTVSLGEEEYFVLGDNRKVSSDSRTWGTLPREDIVGRVLVRLYPFNKVGVLPGTVRYQESK